MLHYQMPINFSTNTKHFTPIHYATWIIFRSRFEMLMYVWQ